MMRDLNGPGDWESLVLNRTREVCVSCRTDLVKTPTLAKRRQLSFAVIVIYQNIAVAISCSSVSRCTISWALLVFHLGAKSRAACRSVGRASIGVQK